MKPTVSCELLKLEAVGGHPVGTYVAHVHRTSDHPLLGPDEGTITVTSQVLRICFECGIIETANTFYKFK